MKRRQFLGTTVFGALATLPLIGGLFQQQQLRRVFAYRFVGQHCDGLGKVIDDFAWVQVRMADLKAGEQFVLVESDGTFVEGKPPYTPHRVVGGPEPDFVTLRPAVFVVGNCCPAADDKTGVWGIEADYLRDLTHVIDYDFPDIVCRVNRTESGAVTEPQAICTKAALKPGEWYYQPVHRDERGVEFALKRKVVA